jgi:hypothetical protein
MNGLVAIFCFIILFIFGDHRPDDGGSKLLWNVGQYLPEYTAPISQKAAIFNFAFDFNNTMYWCLCVEVSISQW